jgi:sporulation protein YpjB
MLWKRNTKWFGIVLVLSLSSTLLFGCSSAKGNKPAITPPSQEQLQKVELLNQTADDMYQKVMQGDVSGGRVVLQQLSDQVTQIRFEGITSVEGMNALTESVTQAKRVFNAAKFNPGDGQVSAAKIRLATDALTHANQPMWLQYDKLLQDDVNMLEHAAKEQNKAQLQKGAAQLEQHYGVIHPSLLISRSATDVEKMDSLAAFVKTQIASSADPYKNILNAVPPIRQVLDKLFMKRETTAYLPYADQQNPILWTLVIGSVIMMALGFAGWRLSKKDHGLVTIHRNDGS